MTHTAATGFLRISLRQKVLEFRLNLFPMLWHAFVTNGFKMVANSCLLGPISIMLSIQCTGVCCGRNRWSRFLLTKSYATGQESYYILLSCAFWLCPPSSNTLSWESPHWDTQLGAEGGQKSYWWQKYPEFKKNGPCVILEKSNSDCEAPTSVSLLPLKYSSSIAFTAHKECNSHKHTGFE